MSVGSGLMSVLFVDDEENILSSIKRLLIDEEVDVLTASSGEDGVEVLKSAKEDKNIALVVSDQRMPGMGGVEFLAKAKKTIPYAQRILLTGYADIDVIMNAINKAGAYRYITKPWNDDEILQIIKDAVKRYELIMENKRLSALVKKKNAELKKWNDELEQFVRSQNKEIQSKNEELQALNNILKNDFESLIASFLQLIEFRDSGAGQHSKNVTEMSVQVAKKMGFSSEDIENIAAASLLHDIGKIGMSDIILLKEFEDMSSDEKEEYMTHPIRGQIALESVSKLKKAAVIIRHHHEYYNGMGFPDGLAGKRIPVASRILTIADFIDRSIRSVRGQDAIRVALQKASRELGRIIDPAIYDIFEDVIIGTYKRILARILDDDEVIKESAPADLKPGMIIARDMKLGTLILPKGKTLLAQTIALIQHYYRLNPTKAKGGIFIKVKR